MKREINRKVIRIQTIDILSVSEKNDHEVHFSRTAKYRPQKITLTQDNQGWIGLNHWFKPTEKNKLV